jgi:hypothetical protein
MAHEFADAQLALRAAAARACVVLMASTGHDRPEFSDARFDPRVHRFGERDQPGMMGEMQFARLRLELTASVAPSPLDSIR